MNTSEMTPSEYGRYLASQVTRPLADWQIEAGARILAGVGRPAEDD